MQINSINTNYNNIKYNSNRKGDYTNSQPSFKGGLSEKAIDGLANFYRNQAQKPWFQNFIKNFSKSDRTFPHVLFAESCFLSGFYMINTLRNKKIKKEQKPQMLINDTLTLGISTLGSYLVEDKISAKVAKLSEKYFETHKNFYKELGKDLLDSSIKAKQSKGQTAIAPLAELLGKVENVVTNNSDDLSKGLDDVANTLGNHLKNIVGKEGKLKTFQINSTELKNMQDTVKNVIKENIKTNKAADKTSEAVKAIVEDSYNNSMARTAADNILPGFNKLKALIIFGIIYRYLGPVVITPIANKLSSKLFKKDDQKKA